MLLLTLINLHLFTDKLVVSDITIVQLHTVGWSIIMHLTPVEAWLFRHNNSKVY